MAMLVMLVMFNILIMVYFKMLELFKEKHQVFINIMVLYMVILMVFIYMVKLMVLIVVFIYMELLVMRILHMVFNKLLQVKL